MPIHSGPPHYALGIDIGGTFTDLVALSTIDGKYKSTKVLTTPTNPQKGVANGLNELLPLIGGGKNVMRVIHATTLFSNALIERKGAPTGLISTYGFQDTLELGRERKYDIYDLFLKFPKPVVPRKWRVEVKGRIGTDGTILAALDKSNLLQVTDNLISKGIKSIAITFLNSHINPIHEIQAAEIISNEHPNLAVTISSDVSRHAGEFERTSTAVINAFVKPLTEKYVDGLVSVLKHLNIRAPFMLMLSNGGLTHVDEAKRLPVQLLESGPAAGALSASLIGGAAGENHLLAFDMGGTTAKLAIIDNRVPEISYRFEAARERRFSPGSGLPVSITTVELIEIGAGGGSIAHRDDLGLLKVGPQSAGAEPGPACYSKGGNNATVTDADLFLGYLDPTGFSESSLVIDKTKASRSIKTLGENMKLSARATALGIHQVVCEMMAQAAQVHLARKGRDPRDYTLYATGGAAPLHAYSVANRLGMSRVLIPAAAGVASALGLCIAPARSDRNAAVGQLLSQLNIVNLNRIFNNLETEANAIIHTTIKNSTPISRRLGEFRYQGQGTVLVVDITDCLNSSEPKEAISAAFHDFHEKTYGRRLNDVDIELVTAMVSSQAPTIAANIRPLFTDDKTVPNFITSRPIHLPDKHKDQNVCVYQRAALTLTTVLKGPAIIEERQSTTLLPEHAELTIDKDQNILISTKPYLKIRPSNVESLNDPVNLEILWNRTIAAVDEAAASLLRSAFSTVVRESYDFSCIVTDALGNSLAQASDSIPSFIGTLPDTVKHFIAAFPPENLSPGDVLITNDPYMGTGHLPDISVCRPLYSDKILIGFAASTAHAPDIGGKIRSPEPREVYEEGLQIPLLKLYEEGRPNETLLSILRKNVRTPDLVIGDLEAQLGALTIMETRIDDLIQTYNLRDLSILSEKVRGRTEYAVRQAINKLPDGCYYSSVETDGIADNSIEIKVEIKVAEEEVIINFDGSSKQADKAVNCPLCYTRAMSAYAIKAALAPQLPNNDGALKPIIINAPAASIVNPVHPASVGSRVLTGHYIPTLIMDALSKIAPDQVLAGAGSPIWCVNINGTQPDGRLVAGLFFFNGGMGASAFNDGLSCVSWPSNISSTPAEGIEHALPIRVLRRALRDGSGGCGKYSGGNGQEIEFEYIGAKPGIVAFLAERTKAPARGIAGGENGSPGRLEINGRKVDPKAQHQVNFGTRIFIATPGGGGYGKTFV